MHTVGCMIHAHYQTLRHREDEEADDNPACSSSSAVGGGARGPVYKRPINASSSSSGARLRSTSPSPDSPPRASAAASSSRPAKKRRDERPQQKKPVDLAQETFRRLGPQSKQFLVMVHKNPMCATGLSSAKNPFFLRKVNQVARPGIEALTPNTRKKWSLELQHWVMLTHSKNEKPVLLAYPEKISSAVRERERKVEKIMTEKQMKEIDAAAKEDPQKKKGKDNKVTRFEWFEPNESSLKIVGVVKTSGKHENRFIKLADMKKVLPLVEGTASHGLLVSVIDGTAEIDFEGISGRTEGCLDSDESSDGDLSDDERFALVPYEPHQPGHEEVENPRQQERIVKGAMRADEQWPQVEKDIERDALIDRTYSCLPSEDCFIQIEDNEEDVMQG